MLTASTNICETMGRSRELSEFQCGTMTGSRLCKKSVINFPCIVTGVKFGALQELGSTP